MAMIGISNLAIHNDYGKNNERPKMFFLHFWSNWFDLDVHRKEMACLVDLFDIEFTYLIKSNKLCSFSVTLFDGLAAISHSNFGRQASRRLFAKLIFSFKVNFFSFAIPSVVSIDDWCSKIDSISFTAVASTERNRKTK